MSEVVQVMIGGSANLYKRDDLGDVQVVATYPSDDADDLVVGLTQTVAELQKRNDAPECVRLIQHFAFFPSEVMAKEFAKWLVDDNYDSITVTYWGDEKWRVDFYNPGFATLSYLIACCSDVRGKVREAGGEYDGWELPAMPAEG